LAKTAGVLTLLLGVAGGLVGILLYFTCTFTFFGRCLAFGYRNLGYFALGFGRVLIVVGIVLLALPVHHQAPQALLQPLMQQTGYPMPPPAYLFAPPGSARAEKFCPTCGSRYPADYKLCPKDSSELRSLVEGVGPP